MNSRRLRELGLARLAAVAALALLFGSTPSARAANKTLRVADANAAGTVVIELQPKETAAVVLVPDAADYPLRLLRATVRVGAPILSTRGHTGSGTMRLHVWRDTGATDPGPSLYEGPTAIAVRTGDNSFDLSGEGLLVATGNLRVGFEVVVEGADVATDSGLTPGKNFILGKQTGTADTFRWQPSPSSFLSGDFLISLEVETQAGDGGIALPDAGAPLADAGTTVSDGGASDGGAEPPIDAGVIDAGVIDGGRRDAGAPGDGGNGRYPQNGCFCALSSQALAAPSGWLGALAFAALLVLRRRLRGR